MYFVGIAGKRLDPDGDEVEAPLRFVPGGRVTACLLFSRFPSSASSEPCPVGGTAGGSPSAGRGRRGCSAASSGSRRGRAVPARCAGRRRRESMCVAKLCRSVCGLTVCGSPARLQYFFTSAHRRMRVSGRPDLLTNRQFAGPIAVSACLRSACRLPPEYARSAATAGRPSGTTRCLLPFPKHLQNAASRYTSASFSPTTSDARQPVA